MNRITTGSKSLLDATLDGTGAFATKKTTHMDPFFYLPSVDDIDNGCMHYRSRLEDYHLICTGCGAKWHCTCVLGAFPLDLLFWYCRNCCKLNVCGPAMNVALKYATCWL